MDSDPKINVQQMLGTVELKSWFEADLMPNGDISLNGRSCAITRNRDGSVREVKFSDTATRAVIPMSVERDRKPSIFAKLAGWMRPNG